MANPIKHRYTEFGQDMIEAATYAVTTRDVFKLEYLYIMIHDWLADEGWGSRDDSKFGETYYMQREHPQHGKEIWIRWRLTKQAPVSPKTYLWIMDLDFKIIGLKDTEIVYKNQKVKMDRGEFELACRGALIIDHGKEWEKSALKRLKRAWLRRVHRHQLGIQKKAIYEECYRLRDLVLSYLKFENIFPEKEAGEFYIKRTLE